MKQDSSLHNFDWGFRSKQIKRPDYNQFFNILDEAGVSCAADLRKKSEYRITENPLRSIMSQTIQQTIAWLNRTDSNFSQQVRIISDAPNSELLFLSSLLTDDSVILSDSSALLWSTELPNPIHAMYWEGLMDQLILCRSPLLNGDIILCPAIVHRTVGRGNDVEEEYVIDYSSSLSFPEGTFLRKKQTSNLNQVPEGLVRAAKYKSTELPSSVPLISLNLPIIKGVPVDTLRKLFEEDTDALMRLRFVLNEMNLFSSNQLITSNGLQEIAQRLEYEISQVQIEYERLIRKRHQLLANAGLGALGLIISVSFPESFAPIAATLGGAAAGVNSLKYVFSIKETKAEIRSKDYYFAWKAWKLKNK